MASADVSETLHTNPPTKERNQFNDLSCATFQKANEVDVSCADDSRQAWITGCCFMPGGELILCDYGNQKVKVFGSSFELLSSIKLPVAPFDLTSLDNSTVIVTLPKECKLQHIQVVPYLITSHVKILDKWCWGVAVATSFICVMCDRGNVDAELRVYDVSWNLLNRIGVNPDGTNNGMFEVGRYISVNKAGTKIFATDWETNTVWCLTRDGEIVYQYKNEELRKPRGIYVDDKDNVIVGSWKSDCVHIIPFEGGLHKLLLSSKEGITGSQCISFRPSDGVLSVGSFSKNVMPIYKLNFEK